MIIDYYKLLGLTDIKNKGVLTDEIVKQHYDNIINQIEAMINSKGIDSKIIELKEDIEDAYKKLKTSNSRKEYDEYINNLEKEEKTNSNIDTKKEEIDNKKIEENKEQNNIVSEVIKKKYDINYIPIYKGNFNKVAPKKPELDDQER